MKKILTLILLITAFSASAVSTITLSGRWVSEGGYKWHSAKDINKILKTFADEACTKQSGGKEVKPFVCAVDRFAESLICNATCNVGKNQMLYITRDDEDYEIKEMIPYETWIK